jgi:alkylhydroperoxidase family enzyme
MEGERGAGVKREAWIETVPEEQATGLLKELYDRERDQRVGVVDNILKVHSLHPETLRAHADLYHTVMHGPSGVSPVEREMIAVVVSALNRCHY